ncbi:MAG: hypothetical protein QXV04_02290, partial [Desulfurococcaceae archaeon]
MVFKLLEGEAYLYNGLLFLTKGYQHPEGFVVAYPRYSLLTGTKLRDYERLQYSTSFYWSCIKQRVPTIPLSEAVVYKDGSLSSAANYIIELIRSLLEVDVYLTGSALIADSYNDIDIVVYGANQGVVERLSEAFNRGVIERSEWLIIEDYLGKHSKEMSLSDYLYLKRRTLLHGNYRGTHINLKLVEMKQGFNGCVDPVYSCSSYTGVVKLIEPLNPHLIPARYRVELDGREA